MNRLERMFTARVAIAALLFLVLIGWAGNLWASYQISTNLTRRQEEQGKLTQERLCYTFRRLYDLKPPAPGPARDQSRAYLDRQHEVLGQLGTDIGCSLNPVLPSAPTPSGGVRATASASATAPSSGGPVAIPATEALSPSIAATFPPGPTPPAHGPTPRPSPDPSPAPSGHPTCPVVVLILRVCTTSLLAR